MRSKGLTMRQSKFYLIASVTAIICAEITAEVIQLWVVANPSISTISAYNGTLGNVPMAITVGSSVLLAYGLIYQSIRRIVSLIAIGVALTALSFIFVSYLNILSSTIEYYPGFYSTIQSGPLSNLFIVGMVIAIAAPLSYAFRNELVRKTKIAA